MHLARRWQRGAGVLLAIVGAGCSAVRGSRPRHPEPSFFPLVPRSQWEYVVGRPAGQERFRFVATVRDDDFHSADGRACRIVDERYGDTSGDAPYPVLYCSEGGFLHRVMSLEYRDHILEDNGLRSGEVKFLPLDLGRAHAWEGLTSAYRLPDGSRFEVQQQHEVAAIPERVTVPAGAFDDCVRVETTAVHAAIGPEGETIGPRLVYYYSDWYAPGVGLVRTEQRSDSGEVLATIELVRYEIGGESARP